MSDWSVAICSCASWPVGLCHLACEAPHRSGNVMVGPSHSLYQISKPVKSPVGWMTQSQGLDSGCRLEVEHHCCSLGIFLVHLLQQVLKGPQPTFIPNLTNVDIHLHIRSFLSFLFKLGCIARCKKHELKSLVSGIKDI